MLTSLHISRHFPRNVYIWSHWIQDLRGRGIDKHAGANILLRIAESDMTCQDNELIPNRPCCSLFSAHLVITLILSSWSWGICIQNMNNILLIKINLILEKLSEG